MTNVAVDLYLIYHFIKRLTTPFNKTDAYELGIIDDKGTKLKDPETKEEKDSYRMFDRLVFNLKKLLQKVPGGRSKFASYAAALFLIKESQKDGFNIDENYLSEGYYQTFRNIDYKDYEYFVENAPTNSAGTGANVAGLGDNPPVKKKKRKEKIKKRVPEFYINEEISASELKDIEKYADKLFAAAKIDVEFSKHFRERLNDERNKKPITSSEMVRLFRQTWKKHGKKIPNMGTDAQAVIKDMTTDINMPFVLRWSYKDQELDLVAKTVMRKKGFKTPNKVLNV